MTIELNHTIVHARDKEKSAAFLAHILGLEVGGHVGPFVQVQLANGVTLDYATSDSIITEHYAFLVGDDEFDAAFGRITAEGIQYWAYPSHEQPNQINDRLGGRGLYFDDPDGHAMEILTKA
jgi:catechol 2,3-dioxygenase-like lactoylglutathione lyase family enzyme